MQGRWRLPVACSRGRAGFSLHLCVEVSIDTKNQATLLPLLFELHEIPVAADVESLTVLTKLPLLGC